MRCGRELMVENKFRMDSIVSSEYVKILYNIIYPFRYVTYVASATEVGTFQESDK